MPTVAGWTLMILFNLIHLCLFVAVLYMLVKFYRFRRRQVLQKRYPFSVYLMTIYIALYLIQSITYKITFINGVQDLDIDELISNSSQPYHILSLITSILYASSLHGMVIVLIARTWIIYFNTNWALQTETAEWSVHINPEHSVSNSWFIRHRKQFGSKKLIFIIVITYYIFEAIFLLIGIIFFTNIVLFVDICLWIIEFTTLTVIWNKIPPFYDAFLIKKELQYILRIGGVALIFYIGYTIKIYAFGYDLWTFMIAQFLFGSSVAFMGLTLTGFVFTSQCRQLLFEEQVINDRNKYELKDVLENSKLIKQFFKHLSDEFSVELLLSYIEFQQFNVLMKNDEQFMEDIQDLMPKAATMHRTSLIQTKISVSRNIKLSNELPKSSIVNAVYENIETTVEKYALIAKHLCGKYVGYSAEFEINISYGCKQQIESFISKCDRVLINTLTKDDKYKLFTLFWDAEHALLRLMQSAHQRCVYD
eukprot:534667_1